MTTTCDVPSDPSTRRRGRRGRSDYAQERPVRLRCRAVVHRMLGRRADAADTVRLPWPRLARHDTVTVANLAGWLTLGVVCVGVDMLADVGT
jgi:hypothetical protein